MASVLVVCSALLLRTFAAPALVACLGDSDEDVRRAAADALGELGVLGEHAPLAMQALSACLEDREEKVH